MEGDIVLTHKTSSRLLSLCISETLKWFFFVFPSRNLSISNTWKHGEPTGDTYRTHSMLLSWAVTSSLLPLSSRFQRISEERNRTWQDGSGSFIWRQIISAPRAFSINTQFKSVIKWNRNVIKEAWLVIKKTAHWPADIDTRTLKSPVLIDRLIVIL